MPQGATLRVEGYKEFLAATAKADKESKTFTRETFRRVGQHVQMDAQSSLAPVHARSAAGYKTAVRQNGVVVEQSLRKTTGQHPEWGSWQMRHVLVPALEANEERTLSELDQAMEVVANHFERSP